MKRPKIWLFIAICFCLFSLTACQSEQTVTSPDGNISMVIPGSWQPTTIAGEENAVFSYQKGANGIVVSTEPRAGEIADFNLFEYLNYKAGDLTEQKDIQIGGIKAKLSKFNANGLDYAVAVAEDQQGFWYFLAPLPNNDALNRFLTTLASFKGLAPLANTDQTLLSGDGRIRLTCAEYWQSGDQKSDIAMPLFLYSTNWHKVLTLQIRDLKAYYTLQEFYDQLPFEPEAQAAFGENTVVSSGTAWQIQDLQAIAGELSTKKEGIELKGKIMVWQNDFAYYYLVIYTDAAHYQYCETEFNTIIGSIRTQELRYQDVNMPLGPVALSIPESWQSIKTKGIEVGHYSNTTMREGFIVGKDSKSNHQPDYDLEKYFAGYLAVYQKDPKLKIEPLPDITVAGLKAKRFQVTSPESAVSEIAVLATKDCFYILQYYAQSSMYSLSTLTREHIYQSIDFD